MNSSTLRAFIRKFPEKARELFQLLCANCNAIKAAENGERPGAYTRKGVPTLTGQNRLGLRLGEEVPNVQPDAIN